MVFSDLMVNIFTSGRFSSYRKYIIQRIREHGVSDYVLKYMVMNFIQTVGPLTLIIFVVKNIATDFYFDAVASLLMAFVGIISFILSRTKIPQIIPANIIMISYVLFWTAIIWSGIAQGANFLFIYIYPSLTVILLGRKMGSIYSAVLLLMVSLEFFVSGFSRFNYHIDISLRMIAVYILLLGIALVFETSRQTKSKLNWHLTQKIIKVNENLQIIVEIRTQKVVKLQRSILKTMSDLVEYRDFVTGQHVERTQHSVNILLEEMKSQKLYTEIIDKWNIDLILQSVQLHDIGKISISDLILNKPARLTEEEYEEIKKHALFGHKIIERIESESGENELLNHAKLLALTHHEKWDGTGYPNGLSGENIPLEGRIMAIADVYDALISERPYKKAFTHEEAVEIIVKEKGTQFDPALVDIFIKISSKFKGCIK